MDIAKQYIDDNALLSDYNILDLNFDRNGTKTFLFYKPYNNKILSSNSTPLAFTDAVIIKSTANVVIQYLAINRNGRVETNDNIIFYDFSSGYSHIRFDGWLLNLEKRNLMI